MKKSYEELGIKPVKNREEFIKTLKEAEENMEKMTEGFIDLFNLHRKIDSDIKTLMASLPLVRVYKQK